MTSHVDIEQIIDAILSVIPEDKMPVSLHEPSFGGNESAYLKDCIDSTFVSYSGKYVDRFEAMLSQFTGARNVVAVVSGTAALHMALKLAGVRSGNEVLIPALTFVATANAVSYCQAVPHFVDSEEGTLGLSPSKLKSYLQEIAAPGCKGCLNKYTGRIIKAVVPMHTFGHSVDMDPLVDVCDEYGITIIEDAAESLGSYYKGRHVGNHGRVSVLSFNGNKTITTGGGGAILTNDGALAAHARHLTTTAKVPHQWEYIHDEVGYNYRLPNINAALGCAQMEQLPTFLDQKRRLARSYENAFKKISGVSFFTEPTFAKSNYWLNALLIDEVFSDKRDELLEKTNNSGIMTRPTWTLLNKLSMFKDCPRMDLGCSENLTKRIINIPSSSFLVK